MTSANPDGPSQASAAESTESGAIKAGIYLEEKQSSIGTGGTAKLADFRTFWVTLSISESSAEMVLLDDDFHLTPIRETFSRDKLNGPGWHFIVEGEKKYQLLRPQLDQIQAGLAQRKQAATQKKGAAPKGGKWWEGGDSKEIQDPFALDKKQKKAQNAPKKGGWWET